MPEQSEEPSLEEAALALPHVELVALLVDTAERNPALAAELLARAGMLPDPEAPALAVMRARVASVLPDEPLETWEAWYDIEALVDELTDLVRSACSDEVVMLVEDALRRWETAVEMIEYEAPEADDLGDRLVRLHHEACRLARPDPAALAGRLLDLHLDSYLVLDVPDGYADVLGAHGTAAFEAEVWRRLADLPASRPGEQFAYGHGREALVQLAVHFAEEAGDVDRLVDALAKNLNRPGTYTRIVEALHGAGRAEEALRWAREGLAAYGGTIDAGLLDATLAIHEARGRVEDAREETRRAFDADPGLGTYQRLATWCRDLPGWADERRAAIDAVRKAAGQPGPHLSFHGGGLWHVPRTNELVRLFLWDGADEAAWRETCESESPLSDRLWLDVAERRACTHPLDAARVYRRQVEQDIEARRNETYARAAQGIRRVGELMAAAGEQEEFASYAAGIRRDHKRKRNLMAAMNAAHLP